MLDQPQPQLQREEGEQLQLHLAQRTRQEHPHLPLLKDPPQEDLAAEAAAVDTN